MMPELKIKHFRYIFLKTVQERFRALLFVAMLSKCLATIIILKSHGRLVREKKIVLNIFLG